VLKRLIKYGVCILLVIVLSGCNSKLNVINSLKDLDNKSIGVITGSEYDTIANTNLNNPNILYYNSYSDQISALKSGKIDGFLTDEPLGKEILKNNTGLKMLDEKLTEDSYAFAINPKLSTLQSEVNQVLSKMKSEKILEKFENKWMGNDEDKKKLEIYNYKGKKGTIKFATVSGSAPFAYVKNNEIVGYDIDVIKYIAHELDYNLEIIEMQFDGMIAAIVSGKVDMAGCSIIVTEERKKSVLFSDADYTGGIVIITRK